MSYWIETALNLLLIVLDLVSSIPEINFDSTERKLLMIKNYELHLEEFQVKEFK